MKVLLLATAALFASHAMVSQAQPRADLTGRWVVVPDSSNTGTTPAPAGGRQGAPTPSMGSGWGNDITLAQDANTLRLEYMFFARSDMQPPHRFVFALDGTETHNTVMVGRGIDDLQSKTAWDGNRLVITTTQRIPDPSGSKTPIQITIVRTLALESPSQLSVVTVRHALSGNSTTTTRTVYRKQ